MIATRKANLHQSASGFTLVELMVVVAVLGILVAIAVPIYTTNTEAAKIATDEANLKILNSATAYYLINNSNKYQDLFDGEINPAKDLARMTALVDDNYLRDEIKPVSEDVAFFWNGNKWDNGDVNVSETVNTPYVLTANELRILNMNYANHIVEYSGNYTNIDIPFVIDGQNVNRIWYDPETLIGAFENKGITNVSLPQGLLWIGARAFRSNELTDIKFPSTLIRIEDNSFRDNSITELKLPDSLVNIGLRAFEDNPIIKIKIGQNVNVRGNTSVGVYGQSFKETYDGNGKLPGIYIWNGNSWEVE